MTSCALECSYQNTTSLELPTSMTKNHASTTERNVAFSSTCTTRAPICGRLTDEEKSASYYNKEELRGMKRKALYELRHAIIDQRLNSNLLDVSTPANNVTLRGLELILQPERKNTRNQVRTSIIRYQRLLNSMSNLTIEQKHARLASIAAKLNSSSAHLAYKTAWCDACEAARICRFM